MKPSRNNALLSKMDNINIYKTTDLAVSSFLALDFPLIKVIDLGDNKVEFVFPKTIKLEEAISSFFQNTATVSPNDYFQKIKFIKSLIHSRSGYVN